MQTHSLKSFLSPQGVVVIGASSNPHKLGYGVARNLVNSGYEGAIHFVSSKGGNLFGRPIYVNIQDVPDPVDLAVLIVPAKSIPRALEDCAARNLRAGIIVSSGFREAGPEGRALEEKCIKIAQSNGLRIIGPNCIGLLDTHLPLDTTFLPPPMPKKGDVAFISQSGAICAAIIDWARGQGFGFSRLISLGNQADVDETDILAAVADDENTSVLTLYIESISDGRYFINEAARISREKPIIALKVGRFESGRIAAASHTGALAGQDVAYEAAFEKAGVFRAQTSEEMFDWASALGSCSLPAGRRMAVLTNAGGPGVIAADALEINNLSLAVLDPQTRAALKILLPPEAGLHNPIDMLASASPEQYKACLGCLLQDDNVDGVLVILPPPPMYTADEVVEEMIPSIHESTKPVVFALMGDEQIRKAEQRLRQVRIPEYRFPERAASALAVLVRRSEYLRRLKTDSKIIDDINFQSVRDVLQTIEVGSWLDAARIEQLMGAYRIPMAPVLLANSADEAALMANNIGFPLVLKIASLDIQHKSDIGGVVLGLNTGEEVRSAFSKIMKNAHQHYPEATVEGIYLQKMLPPGQEVIIGMKRDDQFGPLIMFGSGGIEVEGLQDVAFVLSPLEETEVERMLMKTWAGRKLDGFRSIEPADKSAVVDTILRVAKIAEDFPRIAEIDINPLRVYSPQNGAEVLDIRIKL